MRTLVADRVGDYVHCLARLVNTANRRVAADVPEPAVRGLLAQVMQDVAHAVRVLPAADRVGPTTSRPGTLDLSATFHILRTPQVQERIGDILKLTARPPIPYGQGMLAYHAAVRMVLANLVTLCKLWSQVDLLQPHQLTLHLKTVTELGSVWKALGWTVTPWLHWTVTGLPTAPFNPPPPGCSLIPQVIQIRGGVIAVHWNSWFLPNERW